MTTVHAHFDRRLNDLRDGILLMGSPSIEEEMRETGAGGIDNAQPGYGQRSVCRRPRCQSHAL